MKTIKPKKKKTPAQLRAKEMKVAVIDLDHICSLIARGRANGLCETCGRAGSQTHHFFSKKMHAAVRWDTDNLLWLCFGCHIGKIHREGYTEGAREVMIERLDEKGFAELKERADQLYKFSILDYPVIKMGLVGQI
jgi:5-methylcytosine-specific restriction endonuclease McrA